MRPDLGICEKVRTDLSDTYSEGALVGTEHEQRESNRRPDEIRSVERHLARFEHLDAVRKQCRAGFDPF